MSINIILPLKLNPIPSRIQSSTPPSLTSSSNLLWILELWGEGGGLLLTKARTRLRTPSTIIPPPFLPRIQGTDRFALAWSVRSGSSTILKASAVSPGSSAHPHPKTISRSKTFFSRRLHTIIQHSFHYSPPSLPHN
jgi:hypothetical protein